MTDDLTRDAHFESLHDQAKKLAREDAQAGREPQTLTGALAIVEDVYEAEYLDEMHRIAKAKAEKESS